MRRPLIAMMMGTLFAGSALYAQDTSDIPTGDDVTSITSSDIISATTTAAEDIACLDFRVNGVCLFLICTVGGCSIETSIQYRHFNPALVVTSYNALDQSPWEEIQDLFGDTQVQANDAQFSIAGVDLNTLQGGGTATDDKPVTDDDAQRRRTKRTIFKNAEVAGSPGNALSLAGTLGLPLFCPTTDVFPLFPYFLSGVDAFAWRSGLTELFFPETFIPGLREIGDAPLNSWGSVHPRQGFLISAEEPKAAAVMAQRAADIATRESQPHVYIPVGSVPGFPASGLVVFEPEPVVENDPDNSKWQFLVPVTEESCEAFGDNDTADAASWANDRFSAAGDYAWALWRPYRCCEERGVFLIEIGLTE